MSNPTDNNMQNLIFREKEKYSKCWQSKEYAQSEQSYNIADIIRQEKPRGRVLDLGCGNAFAVRRLLDYGIDAYGVDITSAAWLNESKVNPSFIVPVEKLSESPIWNLPYPDNFFDITFSTTLLEHIPTDMVEQCVREILRVTKQKTIHFIDTQRDSEHDGEHLHLTIQPIEWWHHKFQAILANKGILVKLYDKKELRDSKTRFLSPFWILHKIILCIRERRWPEFLTK